MQQSRTSSSSSGGGLPDTDDCDGDGDDDDDRSGAGSSLSVGNREKQKMKIRSREIMTVVHRVSEIKELNEGSCTGRSRFPPLGKLSWGQVWNEGDLQN